MADWFMEETDGLFLTAWESFCLLLYLSIILISSAGCCCSTDSHFPPHILTGPSSARPEGWSACFPVPGDVQFHSALQVTASSFYFLMIWFLPFLMAVHIYQILYAHLLFPLCWCAPSNTTGVESKSTGSYVALQDTGKDCPWKVTQLYCLPF